MVLRDPNTPLSTLPLSALLSQALMAFAIDYEADGRGWFAPTASVFRLLGEEGLPLELLPADAAVSGSGKSTLERHGLLVVERDPANKRRRIARLTDRGRMMRDSYPLRVAAVEQIWRTIFGGALLGRLRSSLEAIASEFQQHANHCPPMNAWLSRR